MTYTCMVDQAAIVGWTAAPVLTDPTAVVFLATSGQRTRDCSAVQSVECGDLNFFASLTSVSIVRNGLADLVSIFRFTANAGLNGTVVLCSATTENSTPTANQSIIVAGKCIIYISNIHNLFLHIGFFPVHFSLWSYTCTVIAFCLLPLQLLCAPKCFL